MHQVGAAKTAYTRLAVLAGYLLTTANFFATPRHPPQEQLRHEHEHDGN